MIAKVLSKSVLSFHWKKLFEKLFDFITQPAIQLEGVPRYKQIRHSNTGQDLRVLALKIIISSKRSMEDFKPKIIGLLKINNPEIQNLIKML